MPSSVGMTATPRQVFDRLVAGLSDRSYGLAMVALAVVGVIGLVTALFLPATPVQQAVDG